MRLRTSLHARAVEIAPRITTLRRHLHSPFSPMPKMNSNLRNSL